MNTAKKIFYVLISANLFASLPALAGKIAFESTVQVKKADQVSFETVASGTNIDINPGDQLLVVSKQGLPLLVFAPSSKDSSIVIQDGAVNTALQEQLQPSIEKSTNEIIEGLRRAETLIQKRDFNQASVVTSSLKEKYKNISSVLFLSGTLNYLMNNKSAAVEDLQKGLALDPNNESAKKLLAQLKGGI